MGTVRGESTHVGEHLIGCLLHYAVSVLILGGVGGLTPCLLSHATWHRTIWMTDKVGLGDLVAWLTVLATGFALVAKVRGRRPKWYLDKNRTTARNIVKLMIAGLITWPLGPRFTLSSCTDYQEPIKEQIQTVFLWNAVYFGLPYSIGLLFSLGDDISLLQQISLDSRRIRHFDTRVILAMGVLFALVTGILGFQMYLHYLNHRLGIYAAIFVTAVGGLGTATYTLRYRYRLHIHHYALFGALMLLFTSRDPFSAACFGLCAGIAVEGSSRWSINRIFAPLKEAPSAGEEENEKSQPIERRPAETDQTTTVTETTQMLQD